MVVSHIPYITPEYSNCSMVAPNLTSHSSHCMLTMHIVHFPQHLSFPGGG